MNLLTNVGDFGGTTKAFLRNEIQGCQEVKIAVGYTGAATLNSFSDEAVAIVQNGGHFVLIVGTIFFEGASSSTLRALRSFDERLRAISPASGVRLIYDRLYHGKLYLLKKEPNLVALAGSANFSPSGLEGNVELSVIHTNDAFTSDLDAFFRYLESTEVSADISKVNDLVERDSAQYQRLMRDRLNPGPTITQVDNVNEIKSRAEQNIANAVVIDLGDQDEKQRSSLNVYFGKGRLERQSGRVTPRPWFEVELIVPSRVTSSDNYPKGEFRVITDDGFSFECKTSGDYHKNFRSKDNLSILGQWIKNKLQTSGALRPLEPVTNETLDAYGKRSLRLTSVGDNTFYLEF